jgi:hypothetical protein
LLAAALGGLSVARAQEDEAPRRLILDASRALQAGNAARFMGYFDKRRFEGFSDLQRKVSALLEARTVASSVDVVSMAEGPNGKAAQVDWILQLTPIGGPGEVETRRQMVELMLSQHSSGGWRIASFAPVEFFRIL